MGIEELRKIQRSKEGRRRERKKQRKKERNKDS